MKIERVVVPVFPVQGSKNKEEKSDRNKREKYPTFLEGKFEKELDKAKVANERRKES